MKGKNGMKNKNVPNIIFIISMLIVIGISVEVTIRRNLLVFGVASAFTVGALYSIAATLLIVAAHIKKLRVVAWGCRIVVIGWIVFALSMAPSSANEDALIVGIIYTIAALSAMVFGILRHKIQNKDSELC